MFKYLGSGVNNLDVKPTLVFASYLTWANYSIFLSSCFLICKIGLQRITGRIKKSVPNI